MQKIFAYIGGAVFTIVLLFGGGFLTGRITADKQSSKTSADYSSQVSRFIEFTRSYFEERQTELEQRESSLSTRERLLREAESRATSDRKDLTELAGILDRIEHLSEVH